MQTRIKRFKYQKTYVEASYDLAAIEAAQAIAEELGLNYNETEHILYMGNDELCGFQFWHASNSYGRTTLGYAHGNTQVINSIGTEVNNFILNYIKTDHVIAFSFSASTAPDVGTNIIKQAFVKGKSLVDNLEKWICLVTTNNNQVYTFSEGSNYVTQKYSGCNQSPNGVSLAPVLVETNTDIITSDHLYFANWMKLVAQNIAFELDGHEYLAITEGDNAGSPKPVIKLT